MDFRLYRVTSKGQRTWHFQIGIKTPLWLVDESTATSQQVLIKDLHHSHLRPKNSERRTEWLIGPKLSCGHGESRPIGHIPLPTTCVDKEDLAKLPATAANADEVKLDRCSVVSVLARTNEMGAISISYI